MVVLFSTFFSGAGFTIVVSFFSTVVGGASDLTRTSHAEKVERVRANMGRVRYLRITFEFQTGSRVGTLLVALPPQVTSLIEGARPATVNVAP